MNSRQIRLVMVSTSYTLGAHVERTAYYFGTPSCSTELKHFSAIFAQFAKVEIKVFFSGQPYRELDN